MKNIVVGIGEVLWDMLPEGKKLGGAPANFAYHVSQFGFESHVVSAVGNDIYGEEIMQLLKPKKIASHIQRVEYPTGTVLVELDRKGIPRYEIKEGVAWDNIPYNDGLASLAEKTTAVCFGSLAQRSVISRQTINSFLDNMPDDGNRLKIFDINLRQNFYSREVLENSFRKCNILKINDEELIMTGRIFGRPGMDLEDSCRELLSVYDLRMLILTCGVNGSYVFTPSEVSFQQTPKVDVTDTVGAGDSFTAAFVSAIMKGLTVSQAHRLAVDVSAYVCTKEGAMPEFPEKFITMSDYMK